VPSCFALLCRNAPLNSTFFRITGIYAMVLGFYSTVFKFFNFGATNATQVNIDSCKKNWWRNLLYLTNLEHSAGEDATC